MPIDSLQMPIAVKLLFDCIAVVLFIASTMIYWRFEREWKRNLKQDSTARVRMPMVISVEASLFAWAGMVCIATTSPDWRLRTFFGSVAVLGVVLTIYRLRSQPI